ncbi:MAG: DUF6064 family protein [Proteobacteria bacterium]|nr:DUF6064 family protein [Pseudomonadota bacterium]
MLSFTADVFFATIAHYNAAIWPAQIVAGLLGLAVVVLAVKPRSGANRIIGATLAAAWLWTGAVFHFGHFAQIFFLSPLLAALFAAQGLLIGWTCVLRGKLDCRFRGGIAGWSGLTLLILAVALYPLLALSAGDPLLNLQTFGVTSLPTAIFTIGVLIMTTRQTSAYLAIIPALWTLIAAAMAWELGITGNLLLSLAGLAGLVRLVWQRRPASD